MHECHAPSLLADQDATYNALDQVDAASGADAEDPELLKVVRANGDRALCSGRRRLRVDRLFVACTVGIRSTYDRLGSRVGVGSFCQLRRRCDGGYVSYEWCRLRGCVCALGRSLLGGTRRRHGLECHCDRDPELKWTRPGLSKAFSSSAFLSVRINFLAVQLSSVWRSISNRATHVQCDCAGGPGDPRAQRSRMPSWWSVRCYLYAESRTRHAAMNSTRAAFDRSQRESVNQRIYARVLASRDSRPVCLLVERLGGDNAAPSVQDRIRRAGPCRQNRERERSIPSVVTSVLLLLLLWLLLPLLAVALDVADHAVAHGLPSDSVAKGITTSVSLSG